MIETGAVSRTPPWSEEAERALLCCMLIDEHAASTAIQKISGEEFFRMAHTDIFNAMAMLFKKGMTVDAVTVADVLKSRGKFDSVGGYAALGSLIDVVSTSDNVLHYVNIIHDKYTMRRLLRAASSIVDAVHNNDGATTHEILEIAESQIFDVTSDVVKKDTRPIKDVLWETFDKIEERIRHGGKIPGVPSGFGRFDRLTSGLKPGQLVIVAGRPSMGKTSFVMNAATNAAIKHGMGVAIFSLEMSEIELTERMLSSEGKIDSQKLRIGDLRGADHDRLTKAGALVADAPIFINDSAGMTPMEIKANLRRLMTEHKIDLAIVDYLQLMGCGDNRIGSRVQEVTKISRDLKVMARDLNIPVIAVSQLNRAPEGRDDPRPMLSDLRESGAIEQDADLVVFIFREEVYTGPINKKGENVSGQAEIIIGKQRNGPLGRLTMDFAGEYTSFFERDDVNIADKREKEYREVVNEKTDEELINENLPF